MDKEVKQQIIEAYKIHEGDTGSPEVQIAVLTHRINQLTEHLTEACCAWSGTEEVC